MSSQRPLNRHPAGAEKYDNIALNESQQQKTNSKKVRLNYQQINDDLILTVSFNKR